MKTFRVDIRVRNNHLVRRREELALSAPQFARKVGVSYHTYLDFENMRANPFYKDSYDNRIKGLIGWKDSALQIANFHGVSPEELWPEAILKVRKPFVSLEMDPHDLVAIADPRRHALPEAEVFSKEAQDAVRSTLAKLDPLEEKVLKLRFGVAGDALGAKQTYHDGATLEEVADILGKGWTRERVRRVEERALRNLRHPSRSKHLKVFHGNGETP